MDLLAVVFVVALAMGFNYTNGFHDAANAIATSVSTRALTPRIALVMAAVFNLFGAFIGTKVADTVGKGIIDPPSGTLGLIIVGSALIGATAWNLLTWWKGLPSSSSQALFGGMVGASLAAGTTVLWGRAGQDRHPDGDLACAGAHPWILRDDHHLVDLPPPPPRACDTWVPLRPDVVGGRNGPHQDHPYD